jgi:hypothetical protein
MKNIKSVVKVLLIVFGFSAVSCENEPVDPTLNLSNNTGSTTSGDYWPTAINNVWNMERNGTALDPIKIIGTGSFGGQTYYKFAEQSGIGNGTSGAATTWLNKNGGNYNYKVDTFTFNAAGMTGTQTGFEYIALKDNLEVGQTWSGTYTQTSTFTGIPPITLTTNYTGSILAKNVTEIVDGETYTNVIKVKIVQNTSFAGAPTTTVETQTWYSKNVGPIKTITTNSGTNTETILVDYTLF